MATLKGERGAECSSAPPANLSDLPSPSIIFGQSTAMLAVRQRVERAAVTSVPVLILGESGTGKKVLARHIHQVSPVREGPLIRVHCAALPGTMLDRELFGYGENTVTGSQPPKTAMVERAQGGTLYLEEVAELDPHLQAKLLYVLQDGTFLRSGGRESVRVDFRLVSSSNRNLQEEIAANRFRSDLCYRINVVTILMPPLRDRRADIPAMVQYFQQRFDTEYGCASPPMSAWFVDILIQHDWPGNIRELENLIRRYVILGCEQILGDELFHKHRISEASAGERGLSLKARTRQAVKEIEHKIILETLRATNWNRKEAARTLKISYRSLFTKLKMAGVPPKRAHVQRAPESSESGPGTADKD